MTFVALVCGLHCLTSAQVTFTSGQTGEPGRFEVPQIGEIVVINREDETQEHDTDGGIYDEQVEEEEEELVGVDEYDDEEEEDNHPEPEKHKENDMDNLDAQSPQPETLSI